MVCIYTNSPEFRDIHNFKSCKCSTWISMLPYARNAIVYIYLEEKKNNSSKIIGELSGGGGEGKTIRENKRKRNRIKGNKNYCIILLEIWQTKVKRKREMANHHDKYEAQINVLGFCCWILMIGCKKGAEIVWNISSSSSTTTPITTTEESIRHSLIWGVDERLN